MPGNAKPIAPLSFPVDWKHPSPIQRISRGLPLIGSDRRVFLSLTKQLASWEESVLQLWPNDTKFCQLRDDIAACLAKTFGWPNKLFHPDDPCAILFWNPRSNLELSETLVWLADRYKVTMDVFECLDKMSLRQLLERIQRAGVFE